MPEETPIAEVTNSNPPYALIAGGTVAVFVAGVVSVLFLSPDFRMWLFGSITGTGTSQVQTGQYAYRGEEVVDLARKGDYVEAINQFNSAPVQSIDDATRKAYIVTSLGTAKFELSGDYVDYIDQVKKLQSIAVDTAVNNRARSIAITSLASMYCGSGRSTDVFDELYSGTPFSQYLVPGDPNLSSRKFHEWADELYPTPKNTLRIARWYMEETAYDTKISEAKREEYKNKVLEYMQKADEQLSSEVAYVQKTPFGLENYLRSEPYASYKYWYAMEIGGLGVAFGSPYKEAYRKQFEDLFAIIAGQESDVTAKYIPYARFFYANLLHKIDSDTVAAKAQLGLAVKAALADPRPRSLPFLLFLYHEYNKPAWDFSSQAVHDMAALSPDFKAFIESLSEYDLSS